MIRRYSFIIAISVLSLVSCKQKTAAKAPAVAVKQISLTTKKPACCTNTPPRFSFKKTSAEKIASGKPDTEKQ